MPHKIRKAMSKNMMKLKLSDSIVEVDETYVVSKPRDNKNDEDHNKTRDCR